jgi:hypothetical protein
MEDNLFSKEQIEQIRKANTKIKTDLGLDKYDHKKDESKLTEKIRARSGSVGGGGMNPADIERVPGKKPLKMKKGGVVSSASKRADGCAVKGKTRGRMV